MPAPMQNLERLGALALLSLCGLGVAAQVPVPLPATVPVPVPVPGVAQTRPTFIVKHPSAAQRKQHGAASISTVNAFGSIQAAISSNPVGPVDIYLPCGVYQENIVITSSDVRLEGEERACVQLEPANPGLPVVTIDSTNTAGIDFDEISNLTIVCPAGVNCGDGLKITGRTDINQQNDFHKFSRLGVYGAFQNGINLAGRTIWTEFENIEVANARGNGINIASPGTTNELTFRNTRTAHNFNYGIYLNNTQRDLANGILMDTVNAEYNGTNPSLTDCAGIYLTGVSQANIQNSYFEGNCQNSPDPTAAEIRMTGTFNQSVNITNSVFNEQYGEQGIYNDSILTTGMYSGDKFTTSGSNPTIYIATSHSESSIVIGDNFDDNPTIVPDGNGVTHVRLLNPLTLDYNAITSVSSGSVDVSKRNALFLYYGPYQISNLTGGHAGQIVTVTAFTVGGHQLLSGVGGSGQIVFPDGQSRTLALGESILLLSDGSSWHPVESTSASAVRFINSLTTSPANSDTVPAASVTPSSHCFAAPSNSVAAAIGNFYLSPSSGSIVFYHSPVGGAVFNFFCDAN